MGEVFDARLRKLGNSTGVIVPSSVLDEIGCSEGDVVRVVIRPSAVRRKRLLLDLAGIARGAPPFRRDKEDRY